MHQICASHGVCDERLGLLHGGLPQEGYEPINAAFYAPLQGSPVRILQATDVASKGIDLQNYRNRLIHLEIPYNPNVMEQRNGRIDRHGQREKEVRIGRSVDGGGAVGVLVGDHDEGILLALRKLDTMRASMGSVNAAIEPQMFGLIEGSRNDLEVHVIESRLARIPDECRMETQASEACSAKLGDGTFPVAVAFTVLDGSAR